MPSEGAPTFLFVMYILQMTRSRHSGGGAMRFTPLTVGHAAALYDADSATYRSIRYMYSDGGDPRREAFWEGRAFLHQQPARSRRHRVMRTHTQRQTLLPCTFRPDGTLEVRRQKGAMTSKTLQPGWLHNAARRSYPRGANHELFLRGEFVINGGQPFQHVMRLQDTRGPPDKAPLSDCPAGRDFVERFDSQGAYLAAGDRWLSVADYARRAEPRPDVRDAHGAPVVFCRGARLTPYFRRASKRRRQLQSA